MTSGRDERRRRGARELGRRAGDLDAFPGEDWRRVRDEVGGSDAEQNADRDEERAAGRDEAHEIQASTGRTSRKRDDDACRSSMPT